MAQSYDPPPKKALPIGNDWDEILSDVFASDFFLALREKTNHAYATRTVYPPAPLIFNALRLTPFSQVRVVIVGQDPYHGAGQAHGLSFSVPEGQRMPPSLVNIFKELHDDVGAPRPAHGDLTAWAQQGVLLLNTVLTVVAGQARSHAGMGWQAFTDAVLDKLNQRAEPAVFLLWGNDAHKKGASLDETRHLVLRAAHPSPLAGGRFFGCKHFSKANAFLQARVKDIIAW
ncbi:MAG: uracil-DNA glycosylase [Defluviitaleaceae bacterium]|nr:uracil-DNA glycosylase [Defluviitaleaceae bacterium]